MRILLYAHWWIPWGILVVGLIAIIKFARGYMNGRSFTAALVAHLTRRWESADDQTRFLNNFYVLLASFALMMIGVTLVSDH